MQRQLRETYLRRFEQTSVYWKMTDIKVIQKGYAAWFKIDKVLNSYKDLFEIEDKAQQPCSTIFVCPDVGSSMIKMIAYQWANEKEFPGYEPQSIQVFDRFEFVFVISFHGIRPGMDLVDAIHEQLLPKISKEAIFEVVLRQPCLYLFDGYGGLELEQNMIRSTSFMMIHHHPRTFVIVIAQPDLADEKVDEFIRHNPWYTMLSTVSPSAQEEARLNASSQMTAEVQSNITSSSKGTLIPEKG